MELKPSYSIRRKLLRSSLLVLAASQAVLLAAMIWIIASLSIRHRHVAVTEIRADLMEKGRTLVANQSLVLPRMAGDNALTAVAELVSTTVRRNPDVVYGIYMDAGRQPWVMADSLRPSARVVEAALTLDDSASLWAAGLEDEGHRQMSAPAGEILEFAAPIRVDGERAGTIRYGISTARMEETIARTARLSRQALLRTIGAILLIGLLSASFAFLASRRSADRLTRPLRGLQQSANAIAGGNYGMEVDKSGTDEIALLAADFDAMRRKVKEYTELLHEMVEEMVREIRDILDNIGQGLFTVTYEGRVNPDYASTTNAILGVKDVAKCGIPELFRLDEAGYREWMDWLEVARMRQGRMSWAQIARLCPVRELSLDGPSGPRLVQVGFQPMLNRLGKPAKLMVLVQDVTEARRAEAAIRAEREKHEDEVRAILGIVNHAALVPEFLKDVEAKQVRLLAICRRWGSERPEEDELAVVLRDLHTLKGSASTYGFAALERASRRAELAAAALRSPAGDPAAAARELLEALEGDLRPTVAAAVALSRRLAGLGEEPSVPVPEGKLRGLQSLAGRLASEDPLPRDRLDDLLAACRSLDHVRLSVPAARYRAMLSRLAGRLGKAVQFQAGPEAMELSPRLLAALDEPLVHILRNALDHGLETPEARAAAGKPEAGRIVLSLHREPDGALTVRVEDDGMGIDTVKVAERAVAQGALAPGRAASLNEAEKARLILLPGLSTRDESDDLSGLGVGMDAVGAWAAARGGRVEVATVRGSGTRIEIRLPPGFGDGA